MSLKDMKDELRKLRKETVKPVSRMRKADVLAELERMKGKREEVPPVASTVGAKPKKMEAKIADVKVAKEKEFPTAPVEEKKRLERSRLVSPPRLLPQIRRQRRLIS